VFHTLAADRSGDAFYGEVSAVPHVTQAQQVVVDADDLARLDVARFGVAALADAVPARHALAQSAAGPIGRLIAGSMRSPWKRRDSTVRGGDLSPTRSRGRAA